MAKVKTDAEVAELLDSEFQDSGSIDVKKLNLRDELLFLNRVAKVVKGGRRFSFAAMVAVGDGNGHVGLGFGKANEVPDAIAKANEQARKNIMRVPLMGRTIPHQVIGRHDAARVLLKPATEGTGLIAGSAVRLYLGLAGVHDILAKNLGSGNTLNVIKATRNGLMSLKRADEIASLRGKKMEQLIGKRGKQLYQESRASTLAAENPEMAKKAAEARAKEKRQQAEAEAEASKLSEVEPPKAEMNVPPTGQETQAPSPGVQTHVETPEMVSAPEPQTPETPVDASTQPAKPEPEQAAEEAKAKAEATAQAPEGETPQERAEAQPESAESRADAQAPAEEAEGEKKPEGEGA